MKKRRPATISVRVTEEQREALAGIAEEERRTVSQVVYFMIEEGLAKREALKESFPHGAPSPISPKAAMKPRGKKT